MIEAASEADGGALVVVVHDESMAVEVLMGSDIRISDYLLKQQEEEVVLVAVVFE
jgi:hypothetical protein